MELWAIVLSLILVGVSLSLFILLFILSTEKKKTIPSSLFIATTAGVSLWTLGVSMAYLGEGYVVAVGLAMFFAGPMLAMSSLALFSYYILLDTSRHKNITNIFVVVAFLFGLVATISPLKLDIIADIDTTQVINAILVDKDQYIVYSLFFAFFSTVIVMRLLRKYVHESGIRKKQLLYILTGVSITLLFSTIFNILFPIIFGNIDYVWIGAVSSIASVIYIGLAISRYALFDVGSAAVSVISMTLTTFLMVFAYYIFKPVFVIFFGERLGDLAAVLSVVALAWKTNTYFGYYFSKTLLTRRYNINALIKSVGDIFDGSYETAVAKNKVEQLFSKTLNASSVCSEIYEINTNGNTRVKNELHAICTQISKPIFLNDLTRNQNIGVKQYRVLRMHSVAFVFPLTHRNEIIGYLVVKDRRSGYYTERDERALSQATRVFALGMQNQLLLENEKQRVKRATHKLRISNQNLRALDKTKDEFMSMASHNLRTPLTSIKGFVSGVLEGDAGEINDMQRMMLEQAFNSSNRMVGLVGDLLNLSRIQSGKFILIPTTFSIVDILQEELTTLKQLAEAHKVTIHTNIDNTTPNITADQEKIRQVIMNLLDNAIYYSKKGEGEVTVSLTHTAHTVLFKVMDNGIGVPKDMQDKLFSKFHRAENAKKQRPDGTGIGLYMAKQVVDLHKGKIIFKSKEGQGSTFGFTIPKDGALQ